MSESQTEREFEARADESLRALESALNDLDGVDVDLESGILTLEFEDGLKYIVNSHRAARQIWMAAERTAWHFDYANERWIAAKSSEELWATVEAVLSRKLARTVALKRA